MALVAASQWAPIQVAGKALRWLWTRNKPVTVALVAVVGVIKIRQHMKKQQMRKKWNEAGKDVVVLHMFERGYNCPSVSPFVCKLETYLRVANIPYQTDFEEPMGPKGKSPWITLNGEDMSDSHMIINTLNPKFKTELSSHLSPEEKAIAHSFQVMVDEYLLWCLCVWRYNKERARPLFTNMRVPPMLRLFLPMIVRNAEKASKMQGMGRHSFSEVEELGRNCLQSLSTYLGKKRFMMGDKATEVDCALFGMLAQFLWCSPNSPYLRMLETEFRNLYDFCFRMKEKYYPDWEKCLAQSR